MTRSKPGSCDPPRRNDDTPRAAFGVTPQGAALAARRSRFRGALDGVGQVLSEFFFEKSSK
ncbi:MAG: hypothetical protein CVU22_12550 [Betaproteobacteria bacterium HGW-Betaproteobacteria-16]|nr:MAG: hypothetical protein CVU22_12550 [Betaproteobacteria bacterium HGW-Betaproteobacteria-16]